MVRSHIVPDPRGLRGLSSRPFGRRMLESTGDIGGAAANAGQPIVSLTAKLSLAALVAGTMAFRAIGTGHSRGAERTTDDAESARGRRTGR